MPYHFRPMPLLPPLDESKAALALVRAHLRAACHYLDRLAAQLDELPRNAATFKTFSWRHDIEDLADELLPWLTGAITAADVDWSGVELDTLTDQEWRDRHGGDHDAA